MKNYNIIDNLGQTIAHVQVDDATTPEHLETIYGGTAVETDQIFVPTTNTDTALQVRSLRNRLLGDVDAVSATRFSSLTTEQQQQLQAYRQALLDVPQQAGFPDTVEWPTKPQWL